MPFDLDRNIRHTLHRLQTGLRTTDGGDGDDGGHGSGGLWPAPDPRPVSDPGGGRGRDSSRCGAHLSHRSQKATLQPCVHQHCREASVASPSGTSPPHPPPPTPHPPTPLSHAGLRLPRPVTFSPTSGVRLGHVSGVAGCQNAVPWDTAEGFSAQRAPLWREGGVDGI
ncbi:unnamed protein product [Gadus morhua 'NCC']